MNRTVCCTLLYSDPPLPCSHCSRQPPPPWQPGVEDGPGSGRSRYTGPGRSKQEQEPLPQVSLPPTWDPSPCQPGRLLESGQIPPRAMLEVGFQGSCSYLFSCQVVPGSGSPWTLHPLGCSSPGALLSLPLSLLEQEVMVGAVIVTVLAVVSLLEQEVAKSGRLVMRELVSMRYGVFEEVRSCCCFSFS